jgi:hypothetical protein
VEEVRAASAGFFVGENRAVVEVPFERCWIFWAGLGCRAALGITLQNQNQDHEQGQGKEREQVQVQVQGQEQETGSRIKAGNGYILRKILRR